MLLFFIGHFFERRPRRRGFARDEMPLRPLLEVLLFWMLFVAGCFAAALALSACIAMLAFDVPLDREAVIAAMAMGALAPLSLLIAFRYLRRLTRRR